MITKNRLMRNVSRRGIDLSLLLCLVEQLSTNENYLNWTFFLNIYDDVPDQLFVYGKK